MPLYALKLLSGILEKNPQPFTRYIKKNDPLLLSLIAEHYNVGHPLMNRHLINILKCIIQSKELTLAEVQ